ncbi:MAG TPA: DegT/DnrJ/EryC1/StrS family aminotransferase [Solirubrobacteraceae bacterium]|jgi:dTDP-4-amino-4,6-dideoxygalactose transaminase|nr:DegT/DnrJ/EryC1/StrS family aminotransferase [Solirubrobacteraceae bacterium]
MSHTASTALAVLGGDPVRTRPFPAPPRLGTGERRAVEEVLDSGVLSQFIGAWCEEFWGGPRVRAMEAAWRERFGSAHAVAMNSATSALYAATAALGVGPGDEVIVSPYTMSASATCALVHGARPVFADIEPETFGLDPDSVRERITPRTKAIVVVDIFGCPARLDEIMTIAAEHGIRVIEDAAQAPGALYHGREAGTIADIGVFSLNYHKTIQCGEGGVAVTDDPDLVERLALARNHGEAVADAMGSAHGDVLGFNYRLGELEAAIATVQLGRLEELTAPRITHAQRLSAAFGGLEGLTPPAVPDGLRHVYYIHVTRLEPDVLGVSRERFAAALRAEGVPVVGGYVPPLYRAAPYRRHAALRGLDPADYRDGICPVVERMHEREVLYHPHVHAGMQDADVDDIIAAVTKVHAHRHELAG